jgi:hypothetical protein
MMTLPNWLAAGDGALLNGDSMKKVMMALLCATAVTAYAAQPNWVDLIDTPSAGKWQIDTNSVKRKGNDVQAWVKIFPSQATLEKRPNQPVTTAHFRAKCGASTLTVDAGVNYNPDGTAWTTTENFVQPVVPGSVWEGVVDVACHKPNENSARPRGAL